MHFRSKENLITQWHDFGGHSQLNDSNDGNGNCKMSSLPVKKCSLSVDWFSQKYFFHLPHLQSIVLRKTGLRKKPKQYWSWTCYSSAYSNEKQGLDKRQCTLPIPTPHPTHTHSQVPGPVIPLAIHVWAGTRRPSVSLLTGVQLLL